LVRAHGFFAMSSAPPMYPPNLELGKLNLDASQAPRDPNQLAKSIIDIATGEKPDRDPTPEEQGEGPCCGGVGEERWEGAGFGP
jgi:hypothetical protein